MRAPYGLDPVDNCFKCKMRPNRMFCSLNASALETFEKIKYAAAYPKGAVLFIEGQMPRGIYMLCRGHVKLYVSDGNGKTLIVKIVGPGEALGLGASMSGRPYDLTAETLEPCQLSFVKREDLLRFLKHNSDACFKVVEQLSEKYNNTCQEIRSVALSHSASQKLAKFLLEWNAKGHINNGELDLDLPEMFTHEELGQLIGTSRETVTRAFADLKRRNIVQEKGSRLIANKEALLALATAG
jgi:CRP/FNR family transcriptional regulator, cyclic AMP receptor protein